MAAKTGKKLKPKVVKAAKKPAEKAPKTSKKPGKVAKAAEKLKPRAVPWQEWHVTQRERLRAMLSHHAGLSGFGLFGSGYTEGELDAIEEGTYEWPEREVLKEERRKEEEEGGTEGGVADDPVLGRGRGRG
jgi:hypothetical protein